MQIALMLEYQKSVDLQTLSRLHKPSHATLSYGKCCDEATSSALPWLRHGWVFID
jgi:hypothetical protein